MVALTVVLSAGWRVVAMVSMLVGGMAGDLVVW